MHKTELTDSNTLNTKRTEEGKNKSEKVKKNKVLKETMYKRGK